MTRTLFQLAFSTSIFFFTSASSCDAGDRAQSGVCPAGEVCDPATEEGLHFRGARFTEGLLDFGDVKTLAVGGVQEIDLFDVDSNGAHVPLALPFDAAIAHGAATVEVKRDSGLVLRGAADATGFLRITSAASGELFDRTLIIAHTLETVRLEPTFGIAFDGHRESFLYAPGSVGLVRLVAGGSWLVDESATISGAGVTQRAWDSFAIGNLAPGVHTLAVRAGERDPTMLSFEVGHADALVEVLGSSTISRDGGEFLCFSARAGTRGIHVAWRFEADNATVEESKLIGCVDVKHTGGDTVVVRAFADGLSTSVTMAVVETSQAPKHVEAALARHRTAIDNTAGDRAALRE